MVAFVIATFDEIIRSELTEDGVDVWDGVEVVVSVPDIVLVVLAV